jgi:hypothetical protein
MKKGISLKPMVMTTTLLMVAVIMGSIIPSQPTVER